MLSIGYDLGSSFVKAALVDAESGAVIASASYPNEEMPIHSTGPGWAEQDPDTWWEAVTRVTSLLTSRSSVSLDGVGAIGISYQMHGLVLVDADGMPLRPSIIWCDSRATEIGRQAFSGMGERRCLEELLNSPGNFTASKLRWVQVQEPAVYGRAFKALLPGDFLALKMTGECATTISGLSEGILWNFRTHSVAHDLLDYYGIRRDLIAGTVPTLGIQGRLSASAAGQLHLKTGTPVSYRAGDQPNNALSLNVLEPGEIAATAGTSGVVYAVSGSPSGDPLSRINAFAHVNHAKDAPRIGILLCINGTGSANSWVRRIAGDSALTYEAMNKQANDVPIGALGLSILPFGNGAERMLGDRNVGAQIAGLNFNVHGGAELFRAVQEGVAFAFAYGIDIMKSIGVSPRLVRAGAANMFLSPIFRSALATVAGVGVELYNTDGAQGAARAALVGVGAFRSLREAFVGLHRISVVEPGTDTNAYRDAYDRWQTSLNSLLSQKGPDQ